MSQRPESLFTLTMPQVSTKLQTNDLYEQYNLDNERQRIRALMIDCNDYPPSYDELTKQDQNPKNWTKLFSQRIKISLFQNLNDSEKKTSLIENLFSTIYSFISFQIRHCSVLLLNIPKLKKLFDILFKAFKKRIVIENEIHPENNSNFKEIKNWEIQL
ncbi:hypothetical protein BpHYR1_047854 [Brachionus plicatilis]|uniref:Uncharacterized protein n=1 Tax=Brachionus plicatilis TaxID=10195 RepID=A0A3M7Q7U9_BRAPC|nr:hypothetical protein BpHYR1_047854 [Brachionus plicatilis]